MEPPTYRRSSLDRLEALPVLTFLPLGGCGEMLSEGALHLTPRQLPWPHISTGGLDLADSPHIHSPYDDYEVHSLMRKGRRANPSQTTSRGPKAPGQWTTAEGSF
jgi:hypothetical protein